MEDNTQISLFQDLEELSSENSEEIHIVDNESYENGNLLPFEVGERVRVVLDVKEDDDLEAYFYLRDFHGKRGEIHRVIKKPKLQYDVVFKDRVAVLYHHELLAGWPQ